MWYKRKKNRHRIEFEPKRKKHHSIEIERELLESLHHGNGYSIKRIADELGCSYATIYRLMAKYGIERHTCGYRATNEVDIDRKERYLFRALTNYEMNSRKNRKPKVQAQGTSDSNFDAYFAPLRTKKHMYK